MYIYVLVYKRSASTLALGFELASLAVDIVRISIVFFSIMPAESKSSSSSVTVHVHIGLAATAIIHGSEGVEDVNPGKLAPHPRPAPSLGFSQTLLLADGGLVVGVFFLVVAVVEYRRIHATMMVVIIAAVVVAVTVVVLIGVVIFVIGVISSVLIFVLLFLVTVIVDAHFFVGKASSTRASAAYLGGNKGSGLAIIFLGIIVGSNRTLGTTRGTIVLGVGRDVGVGGYAGGGGGSEESLPPTADLAQLLLLPRQLLEVIPGPVPLAHVEDVEQDVIAQPAQGALRPALAAEEGEGQALEARAEAEVLGGIPEAVDGAVGYLADELAAISPRVAPSPYWLSNEKGK